MLQIQHSKMCFCITCYKQLHMKIKDGARAKYVYFNIMDLKFCIALYIFLPFHYKICIYVAALSYGNDA